MNKNLVNKTQRADNTVCFVYLTRNEVNKWYNDSIQARSASLKIAETIDKVITVNKKVNTDKLNKC